MPPFKILICGAGVSGPAIAFWLSKLQCEIVVLERTPDLRASGQQIDLRGQGIDVIRKMGLESAIRASRVEEQGLRFVDARGRSKAFLAANKTGKGRQSFTSELEIMRGDLVRIFYTATKDNDRVKYRFGVSVESFEQDAEVIRVRLSDGTEDKFDLFVGADGQNSKTRRFLNGMGKPDLALRPLDLLGAYCTIPCPQEPGEDSVARVYNSTGGRMIMTRRNRPDSLQLYLFSAYDTEPLRRSLKLGDVAEKKKIWADYFMDDGWKTEEYLQAMLASPAADDFYAEEICQIKTETWSRGRIVLAGDAAHCPSPVTGLGTTCALVGAYILAGELARHCQLSKVAARDEPVRSPDAVTKALESYHGVLSPFIQNAQKLPLGVPKLAYPRTSWGITVYHTVLGLATALRLPQLAGRFGSDQIGGLILPDYPELRD